MPIGFVRRPLTGPWDEIVLTVPRDRVESPPYCALEGIEAARRISSVMFGYVATAAECLDERDMRARLNALRRRYDERIVKLYSLP
jgi:hypothetical protein